MPEGAVSLPAELSELAQLSAQWGRDALLTQGAGGNTSLKHDGTLWVKASGLWLAEATMRPSFVPLDLALLRGTFADGTAQVPSAQRRTGDNDLDRLRPSIEASLHALLPQRVVVHLHSVATIVWAVRDDAKARLAERLAGLSWCFVPYARPGLPLTRALEIALARGGGTADVIVLGHHGLVVGGVDCTAAAALLGAVEARLAVPARELSALDEFGLAAVPPGYRAPRDPRCHRLAADRHMTERAIAGSLYPDHAVFLGGAIAVAPPADPLGWIAAQARKPPVVIVPGKGVLVEAALSMGAEAMLLALALVLERLAPDAPMSYLPEAEAAGLASWEAERYRRAVDTGR